MSQSTSNEVETQKSPEPAPEPAAEPKAAAAEAAGKVRSEPSKQPRSNGLAGWFALVILLLLIAAAGWFGYRHLAPMHNQHQQALADLQRGQTAAQSELARLQQQLDAYTGRINERVDSALSAQERQLSQQLQTQQAQLSDYQLAVDSVQAELANLDMSQESNWRLFEANALAARAANKLWIERDPTAALAFLRLAESHLVALNNPAHMAARQALANDIATLEQLPKNQVTTVSLALGTLRNRVSQSTWYQQLAMTDAEATATANADWLTNLKRSANTLLQQFVRIQRRDTPIEPMIADAYFDVVQQRVLLQLQLAQQAAMQGEQTLYEATLNEAIEQLRVLEGQITDTGVSAVIEQLTQLRTVTLRPEYPSELNATEQLARLVQQSKRG